MTGQLLAQVEAKTIVACCLKRVSSHKTEVSMKTTAVRWSTDHMNKEIEERVL